MISTLIFCVVSMHDTGTAVWSHECRHVVKWPLPSQKNSSRITGDHLQKAWRLRSPHTPPLQPLSMLWISGKGPPIHSQVSRQLCIGREGLPVWLFQQCLHLCPSWLQMEKQNRSLGQQEVWEGVASTISEQTQMPWPLSAADRCYVRAYGLYMSMTS